MESDLEPDMEPDQEPDMELIEPPPPALPNRLDEPLEVVLTGISHRAPFDLNGDQQATEREVVIEGLSHPELLDRVAVIYLPEAYLTDTSRRFPVLYAHDAQNLFSPFAPFGEWRLDEVMDALTSLGLIEPHIIVGVDNSLERISDYTPHPLELNGVMQGGNAAAYAELLVNQIKPYVDREFRTLSGREDTALIGSSLGGLVSLYIYTQAYTTFGKIGALSASLWWNLEEDPEWAWLDAPNGARWPAPDRVWIDIGGAEASRTFLNRGGAGDYTHHPYRDLVARLSASGVAWGPDATLGYLEDPLAEHNEDAWARRSPHALLYLLGEQRPSTLTALKLTIDHAQLSSSRSCEVSTLSVEAVYGDQLRLTVPPELVTFSTESEVVNVSGAGEVSARAELFEPGGALADPTSDVIIAQVEARFGGLTARVDVGVGSGSAPLTEVLIYAPARPNSDRPGSDTLYLASALSEPAWRADGFALTSLDSLSSPALLEAVGGYDRWWGVVPTQPVSAPRERSSGQCAIECASSELTFKVTRGAWERVEASASGLDRENHEATLDACELEVIDEVEAWLDSAP